MGCGEGAQDLVIVGLGFQSPVGDMTTGAQVQVPGDYCGQRDVRGLFLLADPASIDFMQLALSFFPTLTVWDLLGHRCQAILCEALTVQ